MLEQWHEMHSEWDAIDPKKSIGHDSCTILNLAHMAIHSASNFRSTLPPRSYTLHIYIQNYYVIYIEFWDYIYSSCTCVVLNLLFLCVELPYLAGWVIMYLDIAYELAREYLTDGKCEANFRTIDSNAALNCREATVKSVSHWKLPFTIRINGAQPNGPTFNIPNFLAPSFQRFCVNIYI